MECVVKCVVFLSLLLSVQAVTTTSMPLSSAPHNETNPTDGVNSTTEKTRGSRYVSSPSDTESSSANTGGVSEVETGLMFGGVGLAALVFILATVAAVRVIRQKASLEGGAAGKDADYINCSD
ncbi:hypothetical protein AMEX_G4121 [Astyanax mexicanus]|uniref:Uncharacterized protein n=1 Tax=Astyanax mexicanus TaxID=7994 RepID=A0A8T2MA96_ASTMX|nr:hypothetical protein AMEX_G4121 [Astyanax mexicanus]